MVFVFGAFVLRTIRVEKEFGLALAAGVLIDALVIRTTIVPALMTLLGGAAWRFPDTLERRLPKVAVEPYSRHASHHLSGDRQL